MIKSARNSFLYFQPIFVILTTSPGNLFIGINFLKFIKFDPANFHLVVFDIVFSEWIT